MEKLTSNPTLHCIARAVAEKYGGDSIGIDIMPKERYGVADCSIEWRPAEKRWYIIYKPDKLPPDDMICHELMHVVLMIEGFPGASFAPWLSQPSWYTEMANHVFNLALHLEVWPLCERFGYSEEKRYTRDLVTSIPAVENRNLFERHPADIGDIQRHSPTADFRQMVLDRCLGKQGLEGK